MAAMKTCRESVIELVTERYGIPESLDNRTMDSLRSEVAILRLELENAFSMVRANAQCAERHAESAAHWYGEWAKTQGLKQSS